MDISRRAQIIILVLTLVLAALIAFVWTMLRPLEKPVPQETIQAAFDSNNFSTALAAANAKIAANPNDAAALVDKATILAQEGSLTFKEKQFGEQAIALAQQAITLNPKSDEAWRIIGYSNEIMQNYPAAHNAYAKSLAINPHNARTISQEAHAYDLEGNFAEAEAGYRKALAVDGTLDQANMGLGRIQARQGDLLHALGHFKKVAVSSSNIRTIAEADFSAGQIDIALGNHKDAELLMQQSTQVDASYPLAWVGYATELFAEAMATSSLSRIERKTLSSASFRSLETALTLNKNQTLALYQMGIELGVLGQRTAALKILAGAKTTVPSDITLSAPDKQDMLLRINNAINVISKSSTL